MVTQEQINRINALAKKQKETALTEEEQMEQATLRRIYVDSFKENLKAQLKNIKVVSEEEYAELQKKENSSCNCGHDHSHGEDCGCGHNHKAGEGSCHEHHSQGESCGCSKHKS